MKKNTWNKVLALVLCLVLLATTVSASGYTLDLSGDGKVNVWDVQVAVNENKGAAHSEAILDDILGGGDELHPNTDGVYEIYTIIGLNNMVKLANKGYRFKLMKDIDLGGADWAPIANFRGNFDGNLKTISNFKITKAVAGGDGASMGFFAVVDHNGKDADGNNVQSVVKDLNLKNVTLTVPTAADANVCYIGLIAGSNRGRIENCTTEGLVTDRRTVLAATAYIGTIVGRNNNSNPAGVVASGTNTLTATAGSSNSADKVEGITSKLAMQFAELTYPEGTEEGKQYKRNIGIAGYSKDANIDTGMIWQDVSNSFALKSETEQERRQAVVDEMYKMGTVQWTTSELLTYTVNGNKTATHSNIYIPGTTYYGIPYNSVGGGYERAMSIMQEEKDSQGRYVTVTGLENGTKTDADGSKGFIEMMGNDCSSAIGWAWAAVAPARLANAGVRVNSTPYMIPNDYNTERYGMYASGGYQTITTTFPENKYPADAGDTQSIIALNGGAQGMAEYYAKAGRGDALMCVEYTQNADGTWTKGTGHARMLAYEPVIIRNYKGVIDLTTSYAITHEQGDGLFDNRNASGKYNTQDGYNIKQTSWRIDYKYPLDVLLTEEAYNAANKAAYSYGKQPGCGWGYVPVTIAAFTHEGELRDPYCNDGYTSEDNYHPVILPNSGWNYTNWMIASATMTITDTEGNTVYSKTGYPEGRTYATEIVKLDVLFPDAADNLTAGQTYFCTLEVLAGNGEICYGEFRDHLNGGTKTNKLNKFQFVYNPA